MPRIASLLASAVLALICTTIAGAYPTCLNLVPTAETLGVGQASLQYESDSGGIPLDRQDTHLLYAQVGLTSRLEAGADLYDATGHTLGELNAKWLVVSEGHGRPALAAGLWRIAGHSPSEPYMVASRSLGRGSLHLGLVRAARLWQGVGGARLAVGSRWTVAADFQAGTAGFASLGASYAVRKSVFVTLYHSRAHEPHSDSDFTGLNVAWQTTLFR